MSDPNQPSAPPGWYPDGQGGQRWWDGTKWTEHAQPASPLQAPLGPPPAQPPYGIPGIPPPTQHHNRRVLIIVGAVVGVLVLLGAVSGVLIAVLGGNGPDDVARDYVNAFLDDNYTKACQLQSKAHQKDSLDEADVADCKAFGKKEAADLASKKDQYQSEFGASYDSLQRDTHYSVKATSTKIDGNTATVKLDLAESYSGSNQKYIDEFLDGQTSKTEHLTVTLVKEKGDWKVSDESSDS